MASPGSDHRPFAARNGHRAKKTRLHLGHLHGDGHPVEGPVRKPWDSDVLVSSGGFIWFYVGFVGMIP